MTTVTCCVCITFFAGLSQHSTMPLKPTTALHPRPSDIPPLPMLSCSAVTTQESRSLLGCWVDNIVPLLSHNNEVTGLEGQCYSAAKNPAG